MDKTIILDCQTKSNLVNCEDCIAYKQCKSKRVEEIHTYPIDIADVLTH